MHTYINHIYIYIYIYICIVLQLSCDKVLIYSTHSLHRLSQTWTCDLGTSVAAK